MKNLMTLRRVTNVTVLYSLEEECLFQQNTGEKSEHVIRKLLNDKLKLKIQETDIASAHRIGKPPANNAPDNRHITILVTLNRHDNKEEILAACKRHQPNISINEYLTPTRNTIFYVIRQLKKRFPQKVTGCGSKDGRVFIYIKNQENSESTRHNYSEH